MLKLMNLRKNHSTGISTLGSDDKIFGKKKGKMIIYYGHSKVLFPQEQNQYMHYRRARTCPNVNLL